MKTTCQQCAFSIGAWMTDLQRAVLACSKTGKAAHDAICSRFEREPGTMEREDEQ